jgi:hypothetical protein
MKLGMWNRLFAVAAILTLVTLPLVGVAMTNQQKADTIIDMQKFCMKMNNQTHGKDMALWSKGEDACLERATKAINEPSENWAVWRTTFAFAAGLVVFAYLLLWAISATARWVWAGRKARL